MAAAQQALAEKDPKMAEGNTFTEEILVLLHRLSYTFSIQHSASMLDTKSEAEILD